MTIEANTFKQILELPPDIILELVETVSTAAVLSPTLAIVTEDKIAAALIMMAHANTMLEQCGSYVYTEISNPAWTHPAKYQTGVL